jgi:hypothetical protein
MTELTLNQNLKPRQRPAFYSLLAIGVAVFFVVQVISMHFAFRANDDFLFGEVVKGPNPLAGLISVTLLYIGFCMLPISYIVILVCIVLSIVRKQKLLNLTISMFALFLVLFIAHPVLLATFARVRSSGARWCPRKVQWLSDEFKKYAAAHAGNLPQAKNWCEDLLGQNVTYHFECPNANTPEGMSSYALNKDVAKMTLNKIPADVVILFETKAAKDPVGGKELITADNHKGKGCVVLFGDMHIEFIKAEDFNNLRWEP